ncbi:MAG: hypothetical protein R3B40_27515 [Polyangiales bacterium]|nr:hypothetical protein [Myxococcales bacterium]MCB9656423.1 hypothetical protein [Sandaracinaceae bacterium]
MTSPIKPPSGPPRALDIAAGAPTRVQGGGEGDEFKAALQGAAASGAAMEPGTPVVNTRAAELGAAVRAGALTPSQAVDALVADALASPEAQRLEPAGQKALEQHLRTMLAEDPSLLELVGDLSRS